ncbi:MAG: hypothetical protein IKB22_06505 [Lentisphaeria bacterium]|nr:hypothetical protein [Lentisphaeria bacterium]
MSKTFLGIGAGPIQTGIYVAGAAKGGFDRIVLADVDKALVAAIRASGTVTVNTACADSIRTDVYNNVEIYDSSVPEDLEKLKEIAADALAINTALPAVKFYQYCIWLKEAFDRNPDGVRYVYTSENCTTAAEELRKVLGEYPNTYYLDTVIGKMSKIFLAEESELPPLAPGYVKGHLVEEFCTIYTTDAPGIENVGIVGLYPKKDIYPFEEAKLYGHNASHFLLGVMAAQKGCRYMSDTVNHPEIVEMTRQTLLKECGPALCKKFKGVDSYFEPEEYNEWALELVRRMTSPLLSDSVDRVIRDLDRKLAWEDRIIGAMRLCISQDIRPELLAQGAALAARYYAVETLCNSWEEGEERDKVADLIRSV